MSGSRRNIRGCVAGLLAGVVLAQAADDWLDRVDDALMFSTRDGGLRARVSGSLEGEVYAFSQPAPALIDAGGTALFNPRLVTFLDAQVGSTVYVFAQVRVDRGFDPAADALRGRIDEYALRITPWADGRVSLQAGKFAAVVGSWIARHGAWDNPFISAPLPYENQTGLWDSAAVRTPATLLGWAHLRPTTADDEPAHDKYLRLPVLWGPSYAPGLAVSGALGHYEYAVEVKTASLSSRPAAWQDGAASWSHPTVNARLGWRPNPAWNFGVSVSDGSYLEPAAGATLPPGLGRGDYRELVVGQDIGFAWRHVQLWAEGFWARFEIPQVGPADTWSYYLEARYKLTPRLSAALRWNEQGFGRIADGPGLPTRWGSDIWRIDVAPTWRFTPHTQLKLQYSLEHDAVRHRCYSQLVAVQWVVRF